MKKIISILALVLSGCLFSTEKDPDPGFSTFNLKLGKIQSALGKRTSADTLYNMDSLVIELSTADQSTITNKYSISGRSDTGRVTVSPKVIGPLASLRTWKAKFTTYDTSFVRVSTLQSGSGVSTARLDASASSVNDFYNGQFIYITSGTGTGQIRLITDYVGSTKTATIYPNWSTTPTTSGYRIFRKDTVHLDSTTFFVRPGDTTHVVDTLNTRYSILRVRFFSNVASYVPNNIRRLRLRVNGVTQDSVNLNSKTFDNILTYKYLTPNTNHTILMQAFDNTSYNRGFERTFIVNIPANKDTTIFDSVTVRTGTAQSGSSLSTIKLDAGASGTTNFYRGMHVHITGGTGSGQTNRLITAYNSSTKVATISPNWTTTPNNTSVFRIYYKTLLPICGRSGFPSCTP